MARIWWRLSWHDKMFLAYAGDAATSEHWSRAGHDIGRAMWQAWTKIWMGVPDDLPKLVRAPEVMGGRLCIEGTCVPATTVAVCLAHGLRRAEIHADYPMLPPGAIEAVRRYMIDWKSLP